MLGDNRKIGVGLTGFGGVFLCLGILFFFDRALLALGNILFLVGIILLIGPARTVAFFWRPGKKRGTICFALGIVMVLFGWTFFGMIIELFGILNLFGNFFPIVLSGLRSTPIIGPILNLPVVSRLLDRFVGAVLPTTMRP